MSDDAKVVEATDAKALVHLAEVGPRTLCGVPKVDAAWSAPGGPRTKRPDVEVCAACAAAHAEAVKDPAP